MGGDSDQNNEPEWLRNLPLRSEEIGFSQGQMVACKRCGKANPPNREVCLYCGIGLGGRNAKLDIRKLETWENGFNVVVDASDADIDRAAGSLASMLGMERDALKSILTAGKKIPLSRVGSESQALGVSEKLEGFGIKTMIVPDASLQPTVPPTRLRTLSFDGGVLRLEHFNLGNVESLERDELILIVPGVILEGRTESVEKRKRSESKVLHETETSSDQPVIDIYAKSDPVGWRIPAAGFDFSCLGPEKSLIVAQNMKRLISKLVEFAPDATRVDEYERVHSILEYTWPSESRKDIQPRSAARKEVSNVFITNNLIQFTKYSRLQWRLYEKEI